MFYMQPCSVSYSTASLNSFVAFILIEYPVRVRMSLLAFYLVSDSFQPQMGTRVYSSGFSIVDLFSLSFSLLLTERMN